MNVIKLVGMPLVVLLESLSSVTQAKSIVNARDAAAETALRSSAHRALSETYPEARLEERSSA